MDAGAWLGWSFRSDPVALLGGDATVATPRFLLAFRLACAHLIAETMGGPAGGDGGATD